MGKRQTNTISTSATSRELSEEELDQVVGGSLNFAKIEMTPVSVICLPQPPRRSTGSMAGDVSGLDGEDHEHRNGAFASGMEEPMRKKTHKQRRISKNRDKGTNQEISEELSDSELNKATGGQVGLLSTIFRSRRRKT